MATTLPLPASDNVLFIMDLSGYVFRAYHAIRPLSSPRGEPTHATYGTLTMLRRLLEDRKPALLAVAMDSRSPSFRKKLHPEYKANRPPPPEDLSLQMKRTRELVEAHRIPIWQCEGLEADDLIAGAVLQARKHGMDVVIVSADKDLMQLVSPHVLMWDTMRDRVYGPAEVQEKWGVPPDQLLDLLALTGDSSDNIPGIKSVGPKTAAELLRQHGTIEALLGSLDGLKSQKLRVLLQEGREQLMLSRTLVALKHDCLPDFEPLAMRWGPPDGQKLRALYLELGFSRLLEGLEAEPPPAPAPTSGAAQPAPVKLEARYEAVLTADKLKQVAAACAAAGRFALDTEATSTEATAAVLVGLSLSCKAGEGYYVPLSHRYLGAPAQLSLEQVRAVLGPLLASESIAKLGHNLKFDEIVLLRHGMPPMRNQVADTMIASYLLDPENAHGLKDVARRELQVEMTTFDQVTRKAKGTQLCFDEVPIEEATAYAGADADVALRLAERLVPRLEADGMLGLMNDLELPLSRVLVDVEMAGVKVDVDKLQRQGRQFEQELQRLEAIAKEQAGRDFNINSPRQLESILFDELKLPVVKKTRTSRSTDASVLEALAEHHPLPATILEQRQLAKLKSTYIDALPRLVNPATGRIHTCFNQVVAATGRLSSSEPNLQNIPIRTPIGRAIREAFIAEPGYVLMSADYSQIELRVLAHLAHDPVLSEAFRSGEDVHMRTAAEVFGVPAAEVTDEMRRSAKAINFGVIYGMGEVALAKRLGIPRERAAQFIAAYFNRYQHVKRFMEVTVEQARAGQAVRTLLGRRRYLKDMHSANRQLRSQAERIAGNTPIQGSAADIMKLAMVKLGQPVVPGARMILTVHDELVFEVPEARVAEAEAAIRTAMENVVQLEVPLTVDVGTGKSWAEAH